MTNQITAKGGPLDGKQFLVHETAERLDPHPGVTGGHYKVNPKTATWQPDAKPKVAAKDGTSERTEPTSASGQSTSR